MIKYIIIIYIVCKLYYILNIYQESHYDIKQYFLYFIKSYIYINLFPIMVLISSFFYNEYLISFIVLDLYALFFYTKFKVKLKITKRILRLLMMSVLLLSLVIIYELYYLLPIIEFYLIPIFLIMNIFELFKNRKYIKKCMSKLEEFKGIKIAITGSFGKTSTKAYVTHIIEDTFPTLSMPLSYNTLLGISNVINNKDLSIYKVIVFEMGMSRKKDIEKLMNLIKPNITVITNVGYMHLNTMGSINKILKEKAKACDMNDKINIINVENEYLRNYEYKNPYIGFGYNYGDFRIKNIVNDEYTLFDLYYKGKYLYTYKSYINGKFNIDNIVVGIIIATILGIKNKEIYDRVLRVENTKNRLECKVYKNIVILDDSYNSNLSGAKEALNVLSNYKYLKIVITPLFAEIDKIDKKILYEYYDFLKEKTDLIFFVGYFNTIDAYKYLEYTKKAYIFSDFKSAYRVSLEISKVNKIALLIENDMPDIYKRGFLND